ncbi:MAG: HlyC/CorC family transporter [Candidatus Riflebacteria bacterium]|nr:HlyC/CorC family transporter [Candidatus Riflebacteria bacterium]
MPVFISVLLIVFFLFLCYVFSGVETGVVSLDVHLLRHRASTPEGVGERVLLRYSRSPERFLAMTLICINMSNVAVASLSTELFERFAPWALSIGTAGVAFFLFVFCELMPKTMFAAHPLERSLQFLKIIMFFDRLLTVPVSVMTFVTRTLIDALGLRGDRRKGNISRDELLVLLSLGASSGTLRERPHRMARGIISLKDTRVCEIMIPRVKVTAFDVNLPLIRAREIIRESGFSRIPVYEGSIDQVMGVVYFKDLFLKEGSIVSLRELASPPLVVPETSSAYDLLRLMQKKNIQVAIAVDEYGATAGMVTLEDVLEEVVGEIHDEHDDGTLPWRFNDDGSVTLKAEIGLNTLFHETGIDFVDEEQVATLNGIILLRLGHIPAAGESLIIRGRRIEILAAEGKRVISVRILPSAESLHS